MLTTEEDLTSGKDAVSAPERPTQRRRRTLAGSLLRLQLLIVSSVVVIVGALTFAQETQAFTRGAEERMSGAAESLAANPSVRRLVDSRDATARSGLGQAAATTASLSGADYAAVVTTEGDLVAATVPADVLGGLSGRTAHAAASRSATSDERVGGRDAVEARVPVLGDTGQVLGVAVVGVYRPGWSERIAAATPGVLAYLAVAALVGTLGSVLLARRLKRQTFGLEAHEIVEVVHQREAMMQGLAEGVVALAADGRLILASDSAGTLLALPADASGRHVDDLGLAPAVRAALTAPSHDAPLFVGGRVLLCSTSEIEHAGARIGTVTTFRDLTDLRDAQEQLGSAHAVTTALRAHRHEFSNRLHTISGLLQLEEYDEATRFVAALTSQADDRLREVSGRVAEPALAALLVAKASSAAQGGVAVQLSDDTHVGALPDDLVRDVGTVVGNLIDNAVRACAIRPEPRVQVSIRQDAQRIEIAVADNGPGIAPEHLGRIFERGWTTKSAEGADHGFGLALVAMACRARGGDVVVDTEVPETAWFQTRLRAWMSSR